MVQITGTNDAPVIGAGTFAGSVTEITDLAAGENTTNLVVSNSFAVTDVDLTNTQSVAAVAAGAGYLGTFTPSVSDQTTTDGTGTTGWSFTVADSAVDYLAAGQTLTQTYAVTVTDTAGATATHDVVITITGTNDAPILTPASHSGTEENSVTLTAVDFTSHYTDAEGDAFGKIMITSLSANGTLYLSGNAVTVNQEIILANLGNLTFTPTPDYNGSTAFNWKADDGSSYSAPTTFTLAIAPVNDPITAVADTASATEKGGFIDSGGVNPTGNVTTNDADVDTGDSKTITDYSAGSAHGIIGGALPGAHGTLSMLSTGDYTYTVNNSDTDVQRLRTSDQTLTDTFSYTVIDGGGSTSSSTLTVTIHGANDNPVAFADTGSAYEAGGLSNGTAGSAATGNVLTNDTDQDSVANGETMEAIGYTLSGIYGTLILGNDGAYIYTVNDSLASVQALRTSGDTLTDTFTYTVKDASNASATAQVTVTIHGANDNPVGVNDTGTAIESGGTANSTVGSNATGNVLQNDIDVDSGSTLTVSTVRAGGTGTAGNVAGTTAGTYGDLILNTDGSWVYALKESDTNVQSLAAGASVNERFNYTFRDEQGSTDSAVLTITVNGKNDAPVFSTSAASISLSDTAIYNTFSDSAGIISGTDVDSLSTSFDIRGGVTHSGTSTLTGLYGTLTLTTGNGSWSFHPNDISINALRGGTDVLETFEFRITDTQGAYALQALTVNITHANDTPLVAHPLADQIYGGSGLWSFQTPAESFTDAEGSSLAYTAQLVDAAGALVDLDGSGENPAGTLPGWLTFNAANRTFTGTPPESVSIYLQVTATDSGIGTLAVSDIFQLSHSNRAPSGVATATLIAGTEDIAYTVSASQLLQGFSDADGDTMTVSTPTSDHGEVADNGDGTFTVTPATNYNGLVRLAYDITDGHGGSITGVTRSFNLVAVNDAPALTGTAATLAAGTEDRVYNLLIADLKQGFTDAENNTLTVANLSANRGTVALNANNISYDITPEANYNGLVSLSFTVEDGHDGSTTATRSFNLASVNDIPVLTAARTRLAAGTEDTPTPYTVTAADLKAGFTDADTGDTLTITGLTANHGSFGAAVNGVYTYTPESNYNGLVTLSYGIFDGTVTINTTRTFMLVAANDAPTGPATVSLIDATEDRSYLINPDDLLVGFSDVDSITLSVTNLVATRSVDGATAGVLVHNGDGSYTFTPESDFNGVVNLGYTVTDSFSGTPGTVSGSRSFTVNPVNDPPTVTSNNLTQTIPTYTQGTASVALGDIVVADVDANDIITAVLVLNTPAAGYLSDSSTTSDPVTGIWIKTGTVSEVTGALAAVSFHPNINWNTSGVTITTIIRDAAGTGPTQGQITLNVAAGNDPPPNDNQAPTATNLTPAQPIGYHSSPTPSPVALDDIVVTDVDSASVTATLILNTPAAGTLTTGTYNGVMSTYTGSTGIWTVTGSVANVNMALADVSFTPVAYWGADTTITTLIRDSSGTGPAPGTITLHVTVVNQAPSSSSDSVSVLQGMPKIISLADFGNYADPEYGNEHWVIITQLPGIGTLQSLIGGAWHDVVLSVDDTTSGASTHSPLTGSWITVEEITAGHLRYLPVATLSTAVFDVADDALANTAATFSITIGGYSVTNLNVSTAETGADLASAIASAIHAANASLSNVTVAYTAGQLTISDALAREITAPSLQNGSAAELDATITMVNGSHSVVNTSLLFRVEENPISADYSLAIDMVGVNDAPVNTSAQLNLSVVDEDTVTSISESDLLWGYTDPEGNTIHVSGLTADHGTVTTSDGGLNYTITPEANWNGTMALTYDIIDGNGGVTPATQSYTVTPINDAPLLTTTRATLANSTEDTPIIYTVTAVDLAAGFTDADGTTPSIAGNAVTADHGMLTTGDNITYTYHPELNYNGAVVLSYSITDGIATIATTQTFTLAAANDAPVSGTALVDQSVNQGASFAFTIPVGSFTDVDSAISYSVVRVANDAGDATEFAIPGWLSFNPASLTFSGTPGNGDVGDLFLKVIAGDGSSYASDVVKIHVANVNDAPTVVTPLQNQTYTGSGIWTFSIVGIFIDADATSGYPGADGVNPDTITCSATLEDGTALPGWLTFDANARSFSGNPTGGTPYIIIKVTGTDSFGASAFSTFTLNLTNANGNAFAANNPGTASISSDNNFASVPFAEGATLTADFADVEGITYATPSYLWQVGQYVSGEANQQASYSWTDVDDLRDHAATFVLTQSEVGMRVRVQAFFTDDGGTPEAPISAMTSPIANFPNAGSVVITGILVENSVLTATVTDQDGLPGTIGYVWSSSTDNSNWNPVIGATSSTYITTTNEGGKYMKVVATYTDLQGGQETPSAVTAQITAGAFAPQAESVGGSATEKGGTLNGTDGSVASGQLIIGHVIDTPGDQLTIASVESGNTPGLGELAILSASLFTIDGTYGTLTVHTDGSYSYAINETDRAVQALADFSSSIEDQFNYTVTDQTLLTDSAVLTITIHGANDTPVVTNTSEQLAGSVTEAGNLDDGQTVLSGMGTDGLTHITGTLSATDVDNNATKSWSIEGTPSATYGTMTINSDTGKWDYALNNSLPATQALREGDVVTETFSARVTDDYGASVDQTIKITINGANDVPLVANNMSALFGTVTETGNFDNGTVASGTATKSATLIATDMDTGATQAWSLVGQVSTTYGIMSIDTVTGKWTYILDNTLAATQSLKEGDVVTETYTACVLDDYGAFVDQNITITIKGSNDSPVAVADTNATSENVMLTVNAANGLLANDTDPDTDATHAVSAVNGITGKVAAAVSGNHGGIFTIAADGSYTFNPGSNFDYLAIGETESTSVNYTIIDDKSATSSSTVTVTITGSNDLPSIAGASTTVSGAFTEVALTSDSATVHTVNGSIAFADVDLTDTHVATVTGSTFVRSSGTLTGIQQNTLLAAFHLDTRIDSTNTGSGTQAWRFSAADSTFDFLAKDETLTATYSVTINDQHTGGIVTRDVVITVTGTNDAAVISGTLTGSVTEMTGTPAAQSTLTSTGTMLFSDVDVDDTHTPGAVTASTGVLGTLTITKTADTTAGSGGVLTWNYSVDAAAVEYLAAGETVSDCFTITLDDHQGGTTERTVIVTLTGTNDVPVVSGSSEASGTFYEASMSTGSLNLDTASSSIAFSDVDLSDVHGVTVTGASFVWSNGTLTQSQTEVLQGAFTLGTKVDSTATGSGSQVWLFSAPDATFDFLAKNETLTAIYSVTFDDGHTSVSKDVVITVIGVNDAAVISGASTASLTETNAVLTTNGTLSATDVDGAATFVAQTNIAGSNGYGHFSIGSNGVWNYTTDSAHGEFVSGTNYIDSFTVTTADGTPQLVTVTIAGSNSGAVITGTSRASLTESDAVLTATGTLTATDADTPTTFIAQTNVAGNHGYGHFTLGANGLWSYTTDSAHNEFASGADYTDSFTVSTADGTEHVVTVTIAGTDDAAVLFSAISTLSESSTVRSTSGKLTILDVDTPSPIVVTQTGTHGTYGTFELGTDGVWSYTFDPEMVFTPGYSYSDVFNVFGTEGTSATVSIYKTNGAISLGNEGGVSLVDLTVPVGITFSEEHSAESNPATLHNQLAEASGSKLDEEAFAGIDAYMLALDQPLQQVTVRNLTFGKDSAGTTASSDPIIITGASATDEGGTANPNHHEALIVDVTNLPSGSVINFNNVEFAIVIGAVRLTGGDGNNFVIGDSASQWIVLGADDDTLYGGGGDDIIGSLGGNDVIFGDADNDTLFGGLENDTLCGGSGDDVIYGDESTTGGNGVDTALYTDALAGVIVNLDTKIHSGIDPGTACDGILYTTKEGDTRTGYDTLYDIENIVGGTYDDIMIGSNAANKLEGGAGNDTLTGGTGNDTLDGGIGTDTAMFSGKYADYSISYNEVENTYRIIDNKGSDGTDTVSNVESFQFTDGTHDDIIKPAINTFSPGNGATGVAVGSDVVLIFSESIRRGSGTIALHSGSASGPVVASSDDATSATVSVSDHTVTINPTHDLAYGTHYYVTMADGSIQDLAENNFAGTTGYDFSTGADPYAGDSPGGSSTGVALLGLGALGVLAWIIF
ncbi:MAG: VCBS domain-containing protein [Chlorobium sp.]